MLFSNYCILKSGYVVPNFNDGMLCYVTSPHPQDMYLWLALRKRIIIIIIIIIILILKGKKTSAYKK